MIHRLVPLLIVLAGLSACADASRGPDLAGPPPYEEGVPIVRAGLWLDPVQLPPDVRPGECLVRDFVAPGTYRWVRTDCGRYIAAAPPVTYVEALPAPERYAAVSSWGYEQSYAQGYDYGPGYGPAHGVGDLQAYGVDGAYTHYDTGGGHGYGYGRTYGDYGDAYAYGGYPRYRAAGRDAGGFLVWPGKRP